MDRKIILLMLLGMICSGQLQDTGSVLDVMVGPGDNITLHCDCAVSVGSFIVWYRNCSHSNQPPLVLKTGYSSRNDPVSWMRPLPRFHFVKNDSSNAYDLLIINITDSDEGLYYCGTETVTLEDEKYLSKKYVYTYGNVLTRIIFNSSVSEDPAVPWMLKFVPAASILFFNIWLILVYNFCQKTDFCWKRGETRGQSIIQDEHLYFTQVVFKTRDRKKL